MTEIIVRIQNLSKSFDKKKPPVLQNITADLSKGKIIGLVGPDGAGKTTLIRIMAGLLTASSGAVEIAGYDVAKQTEELHQRIGYMPQRFGLYEDLTVQQNLNLYADLQGLEPDEKRKAFDTLLTFTDLRSFTSRLAKNLSGGMKQKLGLACSLLRKPEFLLLDEPSVGVDPISRRELWKMIMDLSHEGITILWSTSYLDEAEKCDEVLLLNEGSLLYVGPPKELTSQLKGRSLQIQQIGTDRRNVLARALKNPHVIDGVIQGNAVRIVIKSKEDKPSLASFEAGEGAHLEEVEPRFEDAFLDKLGGGPGGESLLAQQMVPIESDQEIMIEAKNLTKRFDSFTAVDKVSFSIKKGEIFGLLGPNGAGKSTTFKMLCGLLTPTEGSSTVTGLSLQQAPGEARSRIGYMAQKFSLYGTLSVLQNLRFFSGIYPVPELKRNQAIEEMVKTFELEPYLNTTASELPLGFKQRLALACSLMHRPKVLFLDEPTSGVDPLTRREFWNHINGLVQKGMTVMITTHFMEEAEYCDRIGLINEGKLITIGSPDELKESVRSDALPTPTLEDAFIVLSTKQPIGTS